MINWGQPAGAWGRSGGPYGPPSATWGQPGVIIDTFIQQLYGSAGVDFPALRFLPFGAAGLVFQGNPPYHLTDFLAMYPKFFGPPTTASDATLEEGSNVVHNVCGLCDDSAIGFLVTGPSTISMCNGNGGSIPADTVICEVDPDAKTITLSQPALKDGKVNLTIYANPPIPLTLLYYFIYLATKSVMRARYFAAWPLMMALFIAHYMTLYLRAENIPDGTDPAQYAAMIASGGLTKGILVHRAAGDVSATSQLMQGYEGWGAWGMTQYGELFITIARATCMGPVWVP